MSSVTSADGTRIAYERAGSGPALILVDGALCCRAMGPMRSVAERLAAHFTVFRYDRRGRNESGDTKPYAVEREIEDLTALVREAGGRPFGFGISSGAALLAKAAAQGAGFAKIALFEPPLAPGPAVADDAARHLATLEAALAAGRPGDAVKYFLASVVGVPGPVVAVMRWLPMWRQLTAVAPTLPYDLAVTRAGTWPAELKVPALVLWGEKSPEFLRETARKVAATNTGAARAELKGQNHGAGGKALAPPLQAFFQA
jgi:pimeloyl-ACP methyl ester carboxylesterase